MKLVANAWKRHGKSLSMESLENLLAVKAFGPAVDAPEVARKNGQLPPFFVKCDAFFRDVFGERCWIKRNKRAALPKSANAKKHILKLQRAAVKAMARIGGEKGRGTSASFFGPPLRKLRPGIAEDNDEKKKS